jgi:2Fe-2S ferredoxin
MVKITFIAADGTSREIDARPGVSLMQNAKLAGIEAIEAECGGSCACATCQVYVAPEWFERLGPRTETEAVTIEFAANVEETSRLSCQITVTEQMDGLVVTTPASQH